MAQEEREVKVRYRNSTAYLEDEPLSDGSYVGGDKHTDLPVHLNWDDSRGIWVEVCVRRFTLVDIYNEQYEEALPRPECICSERNAK